MQRWRLLKVVKLAILAEAAACRMRSLQGTQLEPCRICGSVCIGLGEHIAQTQACNLPRPGAARSIASLSQLAAAGAAPLAGS